MITSSRQNLMITLSLRIEIKEDVNIHTRIKTEIVKCIQFENEHWRLVGALV